MMKAALLVIDMQNDFVRKGSRFHVMGIDRNLDAFRSFIGDCRGLGVLIIYTRHCYDPDSNPVERRLFPKLAEGGLRKGTEGWDICVSDLSGNWVKITRNGNHNKEPDWVPIPDTSESEEPAQPASLPSMLLPSVSVGN